MVQGGGRRAKAQVKPHFSLGGSVQATHGQTVAHQLSTILLQKQEEYRNAAKLTTM